jgi:DNA-binding response OmpR family regulator
MSQARKILIIEDEEILAANLQTHFRRCGWDARVACNGKLAVVAADEFLPEFILLDYHLPDMTGFQVLDEIRAANHCCGCVLMTGHPTETVLGEAQRLGIKGILCKPFSLASLQGHLLGSSDEVSPPTSLDPENQ